MKQRRTVTLLLQVEKEVCSFVAPTFVCVYSLQSCLLNLSVCVSHNAVPLINTRPFIALSGIVQQMSFTAHRCIVLG